MAMSLALETIVALASGYLLGSIPFGLLLTRLAGYGDVREIGSGNIGATNVLRTGNKALAAATLLLDALKGTAAVLLAAYFAGRNAALAAGLGAFLGHAFPVWLRFKGGKGVATYIGVLLGIAWPIGARLRRDLARDGRDFPHVLALGAGREPGRALDPAGDSARGSKAILFAALSLLLWFTHRANIGRLLAGTEPKIGARG